MDRKPFCCVANNLETISLVPLFSSGRQQVARTPRLRQNSVMPELNATPTKLHTEPRSAYRVMRAHNQPAGWTMMLMVMSTTWCTTAGLIPRLTPYLIEQGALDIHAAKPLFGGSKTQ